MIAWHCKHFVPRVAHAHQKGAGFLKLLGPGALGEVAGHHHEIRRFLVKAAFNRFDENGNLTDETTRDFMRQQLEALVAWTRRLERGKESV